MYIHVSGCGIISDNARGELKENMKVWSDIGLDLKEFVFFVFLPQSIADKGVAYFVALFSCDQTNTHLESDIPVCLITIFLLVLSDRHAADRGRRNA